MMIMKMKAELEKKSVVCQGMRDRAFLQQQLVTINIVLLVKLLGFRHYLLGPEECFIRVID